jgi:FlaA1/EpsC-like NDP-sugar epimerase
VLRRSLYERSRHTKKLSQGRSTSKKPVLLVGAGRAGVMAACEIRNRGDSDLEIKGFVDDDPGKQGSIIQGVKVLGKTDRLPEIVRGLAIDHVVVSIAEATRSQFRRILDICEQIPVKVKVIPGLHEILRGQVKVSRIRDLEIEDLLGRVPVQLDETHVKMFVSGKTVMVTGAGGSIGSELARQLARFQPDKLLLVERAEFALFEIDRELGRLCPSLDRVPLIADVNDESRVRALLKDYRPHIIFHAAAHKHVPLMENNAAEAVKNNALATYKVGRLAGECGVESFVLVSTDKAVRPTSVMGATKRIAELIVQDLNRRFSTRYAAVRFGNVIGSTGSVIPIFREQIRNGGPVTVTHPDMTRYFMTIPEAAQLVMQAGAMGEGGEIFVLDMGEPVRILDLAKEAITLSGLKPFEDIEIVFTGSRPGEKLFEELEMTEEALSKTRHPKIFIGKIAAYPRQRVREAIEVLSFLSGNGREQEIRAYLNTLLPEARLEAGGYSQIVEDTHAAWVLQIAAHQAAMHSSGSRKAASST